MELSPRAVLQNKQSKRLLNPSKRSNSVTELEKQAHTSPSEALPRKYRIMSLSYLIQMFVKHVRGTSWKRALHANTTNVMRRAEHTLCFCTLVSSLITTYGTSWMCTIEAARTAKKRLKLARRIQNIGDVLDHNGPRLMESISTSSRKFTPTLTCSTLGI